MASNSQAPILVIKHIGIEGPGTLGTYFRTAGWRLREIELKGNAALPSDPREFGAIFCMGGPMNVYEDAQYPFLKDENRFINNSVDAGVPFIGICLGGQLLAKALGAKISKAPHPEIGWHTVRLTSRAGSDRLFKGLAKEIEVFEWHGDMFDIPRGAALLATGGGCNQAFRAGQSAYGLQFHVEVTPAIIRSWVREYVEQDSRESMENELLSGMADKKELFDRQEDLIYSNLSRIIADPA
jgi:GMP synthase (glutamine-hydrolysing)